MKILLGLFLFQFTPFGTPVPLSQDRITFYPSIPTKTDYYCGAPAYKELCAFFNELVLIDDPRVKTALTKLPGLQITDSAGIVIFPKP